jgi:hypothetical protein
MVWDQRDINSLNFFWGAGFRRKAYMQQNHDEKA